MSPIRSPKSRLGQRANQDHRHSYSRYDSPSRKNHRRRTYLSKGSDFESNKENYGYTGDVDYNMDMDVSETSLSLSNFEGLCKGVTDNQPRFDAIPEKSSSLSCQPVKCEPGDNEEKLSLPSWSGGKWMFPPKSDTSFDLQKSHSETLTQVLASSTESLNSRDQPSMPTYATFVSLVDTYLSGLHRRKVDKALIDVKTYKLIYDILALSSYNSPTLGLVPEPDSGSGDEKNVTLPIALADFVAVKKASHSLGTPQFRFWARKMFELSFDNPPPVLRLYAPSSSTLSDSGLPKKEPSQNEDNSSLSSSGAEWASTFGLFYVSHRGRCVARKEQLYEILCYAHAQVSHAGRDRTCESIRRHWAWVPKELTAAFVRVCPTCAEKRKKIGKAEGSGPELAGENAKSSAGEQEQWRRHRPLAPLDCNSLSESSFSSSSGRGSNSATSSPSGGSSSSTKETQSSFLSAINPRLLSLSTIGTCSVSFDWPDSPTIASFDAVKQSHKLSIASLMNPAPLVKDEGLTDSPLGLSAFAGRGRNVFLSEGCDFNSGTDAGMSELMYPAMSTCEDLIRIFPSSGIETPVKNENEDSDLYDDFSLEYLNLDLASPTTSSSSHIPNDNSTDHNQQGDGMEIDAIDAELNVTPATSPAKEILITLQAPTPIKEEDEEVCPSSSSKTQDPHCDRTDHRHMPYPGNWNDLYQSYHQSISLLSPEWKRRASNAMPYSYYEGGGPADDCSQTGVCLSSIKLEIDGEDSGLYFEEVSSPYDWCADLLSDIDMIHSMNPYPLNVGNSRDWYDDDDMVF